MRAKSLSLLVRVYLFCLQLIIERAFESVVRGSLLWRRLISKNRLDCWFLRLSLIYLL